MSNEAGWGGKREGAGRRPHAKDGIEKWVLRFWGQA